MIECISDYYSHDNANIHRGVHTLSQRGTLAYEKARKTLKEFINANSIKECIFVKGTTEAINLVATTFEREMLAEGDEIVISMRGTSRQYCSMADCAKYTGATIKVLPIHEDGSIEIESLPKLISSEIKYWQLTMYQTLSGL